MVIHAKTVRMIAGINMKRKINDKMKSGNEITNPGAA
jgi:hypothetical protein